MNTGDVIIQLMQEQGVVRPRDLRDRGIPVASLYWLHKQGRVLRTGRGLYTLPDADFSKHHSLAMACKRVPHGVVCLLSALAFHQLGSQLPFEVWMAIDRKARLPKVSYPALRIVRFSAQALAEGIEVHQVEGIAVPVYSPAKTVADCFKYRHKIGLDVALEALREYRRSQRGTERDLWRYAGVCRVAQVMKPYLEATA